MISVRAYVIYEGVIPLGLVKTTSILASQLEFCCSCKLKHFWSLKVQVRGK